MPLPVNCQQKKRVLEGEWARIRRALLTVYEHKRMKERGKRAPRVMFLLGGFLLDATILTFMKTTRI